MRGGSEERRVNATIVVVATTRGGEIKWSRKRIAEQYPGHGHVSYLSRNTFLSVALVTVLVNDS